MSEQLNIKRFINLFTDWGVKRIFGQEHNKDILIDFLNTLLKDVKITSVQFLLNEELGERPEERKVFHDLYYETLQHY